MQQYHHRQLKHLHVIASANAFMESQSTGSRPVAKNKSFDLSPIETVLRSMVVVYIHELQHLFNGVYLIEHLKETLVAYEEYLVVE